MSGSSRVRMSKDLYLIISPRGSYIFAYGDKPYWHLGQFNQMLTWESQNWGRSSWNAELVVYIDGLVQDCNIYIANELETLQSCIKPTFEVSNSVLILPSTIVRPFSIDVVLALYIGFNGWIIDGVKNLNGLADVPSSSNEDVLCKFCITLSRFPRCDQIEMILKHYA